MSPLGQRLGFPVPGLMHVGSPVTLPRPGAETWTLLGAIAGCGMHDSEGPDMPEV